MPRTFDIEAAKGIEMATALTTLEHERMQKRSTEPGWLTEQN
jgi:hypothetical protein